MRTGVFSPPALAAMAVRLGILAVLVELSVSANLLTWLGIPYVVEGGPPALKLHPGTDLLVLASLCLLAAHGPWQPAVGAPLVAVFLAAVAICLLHAGLMTGAGNMIVLLDTFLPAGLLALVLRTAGMQEIGRLRVVMAAAIAANAALGLAETATRTTLIPLYLNGADYHPHDEDFRPTALYDHPLTGGAVTMLGLALAPARSWVRPGYVALLWAALIAFGGRMAVAGALVVAAGLAAVRTLRLAVLRDRRAPSAVLMLLAGVPVALAGLLAALAAGLGDRLVGHLYWDASAQARLAQWRLLRQLDAGELAFGTARPDLLAALNALRLSTGVEVVENFWLLMFVSLGAVGFAVFAIGLLALLTFCWRRTTANGRLLILSVMGVASSSNSLGRKSTVLVCLVAAIACLPAERMRVGRGAPYGEYRRLAITS